MSRKRQLDAAAQQMIAAAELGRSVVAALRRACPHVYRQIKRDGRCPELLALWGQSVNVDENVGAVIVHPAIIAGISALAGVAVRGPAVHAGLQHTYGYLFSLIDTPYGRKRDRWITPDLERGLGVDETLLGQRPRFGTLLGNLTYFLGKTVYREDKKLLRLLGRLGENVAPELREYDYASLAIWRHDERADVGGRPNSPLKKVSDPLPTVRKYNVFPRRRRSEEGVRPLFQRAAKRTVLLRTEVVTYPNPPRRSGAETALLIYSVQRGRGRLRLITAFPITAAVFEQLKRQAAAGGEPVRPRYNAYVPELTA